MPGATARLPGPPTASLGQAPQAARPQSPSSAPTPADGSKGPLRRLRLGDWLSQLGLISQFQLSEALTAQVETGRKLGEILVSKGYINEKELADVLALQETLSDKTALTEFEVDESLVAMVPQAFAKQNMVVPLVKVGRRLVVGISNADDVKSLDTLSLLTGYLVVPVTFSADDIQTAIGQLYEARAKNLQTIDKAVKVAGTDDKGTMQRRIEDISAASDDSDAPIIELVNSILNDAIDRGASDVHLEPREQCLEARFRMDGVLSKVLEIPKAIEPSVITRFKVLSNMNITEKRRPQDGRFTVKSRSGEKIDFRVACIATHWGEKIVLRVLRPMTVMLGLDKLGFDGEDLDKFQRLLHAPAGIILVTGPTGSGKTSTLYASLGLMDRESESIITIEDPVEYPFEGIAQIQVNSKIDLTFSAALRTILRQDPDTIMVGEIRDYETLETATNAAMTGHLVLSTLHTNDAVSTVNRMVDMGIPPYMVSATVAGIIAQRLVRKICPRCGVDYEASAAEKAALRVNPEEPLTLRKGEGCEHCNQTGYKGQLGVFEVLVMNRKIQALINKGESTLALAEAARQGGMTSLLEDGKRKVLKRLTTIVEVTRICGLGGDE